MQLRPPRAHRLARPNARPSAAGSRSRAFACASEATCIGTIGSAADASRHRSGGGRIGADASEPDVDSIDRATQVQLAGCALGDRHTPKRSLDEPLARYRLGALPAETSKAREQQHGNDAAWRDSLDEYPPKGYRDAASGAGRTVMSERPSVIARVIHQCFGLQFPAQADDARIAQVGQQLGRIPRRLAAVVSATLHEVPKLVFRRLT